MRRILPRVLESRPTDRQVAAAPTDRPTDGGRHVWREKKARSAIEVGRWPPTDKLAVTQYRYKREPPDKQSRRGGGGRWKTL